MQTHNGKPTFASPCVWRQASTLEEYLPRNQNRPKGTCASQSLGGNFEFLLITVILIHHHHKIFQINQHLSTAWKMHAQFGTIIISKTDWNHLDA